MSDPLYRKEILRLAADAHNVGRLPHATVTGHAHNPTCGDKVTIDLVLEAGRIAAITQEAKACVLTQASASILGQNLRGAERTDIEVLRRQVAAMLETGAEAPAEPFGGFAAFDGVSDYPSRHRCVLLPFAAVLAAFDASEPAEPPGIGTER